MTWLDNRAIARLRDEIAEDHLGGDRYHLVKKIAAGGMGTVYLAEDARLGRQVAIKIANTRSDALEARMGREARIVALLEHPGIVPIHDVGSLPDGRMFYAMKLVQGKRLDEVAGTEIPLTERLRMFEKVCEAVAFAHARGVIHRDLKPQNVMVGSFGEVLVMDWGLAKVLGSRTEEGAADEDDLSGLDNHQTLSGTVMGTSGYMPPEQVLGAAEDMDIRGDVYALGAMLYCLLTGQPPFQPTTEAEVREASAGKMLVPPRRLEATIPRPVEAIVMRALEVDKSKRYASASQLGDEIRRHIDGMKVLAYDERLIERLGRWAGRNRFLLYLIIAYLLMRAFVVFFFRR